MSRGIGESKTLGLVLYGAIIRDFFGQGKKQNKK